jgi:hypothetical protein
MSRLLLVLTAFCLAGCWAQYRIQPSELLYVSSKTPIEEEDETQRIVYVSKIHAGLLDGRSVSTFPEHAKRLFFDKQLDENQDVLLRVNNDSRVVRSGMVGGMVGIAAAIGVGIWAQSDCERRNVNSFDGGCGDGFELGSALFFPGLALGSVAGVILARQPVDVSVMLRR